MDGYRRINNESSGDESDINDWDSDSEGENESIKRGISNWYEQRAEQDAKIEEQENTYKKIVDEYETKGRPSETGSSTGKPASNYNKDPDEGKDLFIKPYTWKKEKRGEKPAEDLADPAMDTHTDAIEVGTATTNQPHTQSERDKLSKRSEEKYEMRDMKRKAEADQLEADLKLPKRTTEDEEIMSKPIPGEMDEWGENERRNYRLLSHWERQKMARERLLAKGEAESSLSQPRKDSITSESSADSETVLFEKEKEQVKYEDETWKKPKKEKNNPLTNLRKRLTPSSPTKQGYRKIPTEETVELSEYGADDNKKWEPKAGVMNSRKEKPNTLPKWYVDKQKQKPKQTDSGYRQVTNKKTDDVEGQPMPKPGHNRHNPAPKASDYAKMGMLSFGQLFNEEMGKLVHYLAKNSEWIGNPDFKKVADNVFYFEHKDAIGRQMNLTQVRQYQWLKYKYQQELYRKQIPHEDEFNNWYKKIAEEKYNKDLERHKRLARLEQSQKDMSEIDKSDKTKIGVRTGLAGPEHPDHAAITQTLKTTVPV